MTHRLIPAAQVLSQAARWCAPQLKQATGAAAAWLKKTRLLAKVDHG